MAAPLRQAVNLSIIVGIIGYLWVGQSIAAFSVKYCSTINTSAGAANYSIFQSNGLCDTFCDGFAYAIVQSSACWCSDYTPADSKNVDLDECDLPCPGFPSDICGGEDELFGYLFKNKSPLGTKGVSSTPTATKAKTSILTETVHQHRTETQTIQKTTTVKDPVTSSTSSSTSKPATKTSEAASDTKVTTITAGGTVQTVTISADDATNTPVPSEDGAGGSLSTGAAVGIAVGVAMFVVAIAAAVLYVVWKKRRDSEGSETSGRAGSPGMASFMPSMTDSGQNGSTRRGSKFMPIDDRMEYNHGLYTAENRHSVDTIRDEVDYSRRVLRTTNPDPPAQ